MAATTGEGQVAAATARSHGMKEGSTGATPSSMQQRSFANSGEVASEKTMQDDGKDDKRRLLLSWVKKAFRNPWLFRLLMVLWKLYDHFDRD